MYHYCQISSKILIAKTVNYPKIVRSALPCPASCYPPGPPSSGRDWFQNGTLKVALSDPIGGLRSFTYTTQ